MTDECVRCGHDIMDHGPRLFPGCDECDCPLDWKGDEPVDFTITWEDDK